MKCKCQRDGTEWEQEPTYAPDLYEPSQMRRFLTCPTCKRRYYEITTEEQAELTTDQVLGRRAKVGEWYSDRPLEIVPEPEPIFTVHHADGRKTRYEGMTAILAPSHSMVLTEQRLSNCQKVAIAFKGDEIDLWILSKKGIASLGKYYIDQYEEPTIVLLEPTQISNQWRGYTPIYRDED